MLQEEFYRAWIAKAESSAEDLLSMKKLLAGFIYRPRISVLVVVSEPDEIWIKQSFASVLSQVYPNFELCICDNASRRPHVRETLEELSASDERVKLRRLQEATTLHSALNESLSLATGEFVTVLDVGDTLAPEAMFAVADFLQSAEADAFYADEDSIDVSDLRSRPIFKPHWSPDLLLSTPYIGRPCVLRRDLLEKVGGFRDGLRESEQDLMLRIAERTRRIQHLPRMLYHRRIYGEAPEQNEPEVARRIAGEALERREIAGAGLEPGLSSGSIRVARKISGRPDISAIYFAEHGSQAAHLSEIENGSYPVREVIPAHFGEGPAGYVSPARAANLAAEEADGEYLLLLRDYRSSLTPNWLALLLREAQRPEVGAVGGRVLDPEGEVLCAGSFMEDLDRLAGEVSGVPHVEGHPRFLPVADHPFNPYAVSAGCMMVKRSLFEEAGGFAEAHLPEIFYDVDLSFRLREKGLLNVYVPEVSVVSGPQSSPEGAGEIAYMWDRWWTVLVGALHYRKSPLYTPRLDSGEELLSLVPAVAGTESGPVFRENY